jgi:hypothetical protein
MNGHDPNDPWLAGLGLWCRFCQFQLDQWLRIWAFWAGALPRPTAAQLSAEAEKLRAHLTAAEDRPRPPRAGRVRPPPAPPPPGATLH